MNQATLAQTLLQKASALSSASVAAGFDGFVDEMITVVGERKDLENFTPVADIGTFGTLVSAAAGHSSLREIVVTRTDAGGCSVNMGDGLLAFGIALDLFSTLGEPVHPAFAPLVERCRTFQSWGREPGRTLAFEFTDGKLMFSAVRQLADFDADHVRSRLSDGAFATACAEAGLIALTNWSLYPHMTDVWALLAEEVFARLSPGKHLFIDLVDPSSRNPGDIRHMLEVLPRMAMHTRLCLGLNGNEGNLIARLLDIPEAREDEASILEQAEAIRDRLGVDEVVVHWVKIAASASAQGGAVVTGPYCQKPKKSTGAGDRFNAGYALGLLLGFAPEERLYLATASSGYFVRTATSATIAGLAAFLADGTV
jgi:hypothetical protein